MACTGYDIYKILSKDKTIRLYIKKFKLIKLIKQIRNKIFKNIQDFKTWLAAEINKMKISKFMNICVCNYVENVYNTNGMNEEEDDDNNNKHLKKELKRLQQKRKRQLPPKVKKNNINTITMDED